MLWLLKNPQVIWTESKIYVFYIFKNRKRRFYWCYEESTSYLNWVRIIPLYNRHSKHICSWIREVIAVYLRSITYDWEFNVTCNYFILLKHEYVALQKPKSVMLFKPVKFPQFLIIYYRPILRWNLKNLNRGLNPPKPGLN